MTNFIRKDIIKNHRVRESDSESLRISSSVGLCVSDTARSGLDGPLELIGAAFGGVLIKDGCEEWK